MTSSAASASGPISYETTFAPYFDYVEYAPVVPDLDAHGADPVAHPVVIAGGGPTGLALALGLARHGVRSVVIEADTTVCSGSRAGAFTRRTLEICAHLGVLDRMLAKGFSWSKGITYRGTEEIFSFDAPSGRDDRLPASISLQQNYVEQYLVDAVAELPELIEIRWGSRVRAIERYDDHVDLEVSVDTDDVAYRMRAEWLVACDGARSTARNALGVRLDGRSHEGRYVIIDLFADTEHLPVGRRCWFDPPSNPGSTLLMYKKPDGMVRLDFQLRADEDPDEAMRPENVLARVRTHFEMLAVPEGWRPVWMSLYRASGLTLDDYRHGRVIFAGDAAHLVPIFGVRGMNSCIDDTHNLAWKLALVARGIVTDEAADRLLASYSDERVFAARENIRLASRGADFMSPPGPGSRLLRDAVLELAGDQTWVRSLINPRQHSAIPLVASPLNQAAGRSAEFDGGPAPGELLPECALAGGRFLGELVPPRFTAVCLSQDGVLDDGLRRCLDELGRRPGVELATVVIATADDVYGSVASRLAARPGAVYLVRPDGHVLGRWRRPDAAELVAAIDAVVGSARNEGDTA